MRSQLVGALGIDEADVRVIVPPTGGGFGGKHGSNAIEAARLARAAGRPVRVHWSRAEEFTWGYLRPMAVIDVRAGADPDGFITGWDFTDINVGAQGTSFPYRCGSWRVRYQPAASPLAQGRTGRWRRRRTPLHVSRASTSLRTRRVSTRLPSG